ncbi:serine hydrolase [Microvirga puerhi]|uniref:Serine hydrolase n=1 Tax=Microvirga puerhi TaxID=2876078 RepID=A0ABS7VNQ2_9HYPH|nr:serine hydrolase [Microvirga puerhi]MBZ6077178.1 serine hydrolase [Microvirga puerhi]
MSIHRSMGAVAVAATLMLQGGLARAADPQPDAEALRKRIEALLPEFETSFQTGMKSFQVPGAAIGIVVDDKLIYSKGFGVRERGKPDPVRPETIFQIGSTTKAFLSTTLAQAVDAGRLAWTDRVSDVMPEFQLSDPWIGREFRVLDLTAQRSGLTPYANDALAMLGYDKATLIRSLREAPITASFRSDFSYTNITHLAAGEILARKAGASSWFDVVKAGVLDPLHMTSTTATAEAITQAPDHATGHRADKPDPVAVPFHPSFPYSVGPAGNLNSNIPDMAQWLRLQLGRGQFEDRIIVSEKNLDVTWTPRVPLSERSSYAVGWVVSATPNGRIIWHNGGTMGFGAHAGFLPDRGVGIVILTNLQNTGFPDAAAQWLYDRILGNATVDNIALAFETNRKRETEEQAKKSGAKAVAVPQDLATFAGTYNSPILGDVTVSVVGDKLQLRLEETDATLTLNPREKDLFEAHLAPTGEYATVLAMAGDESLTPVRFERDDSGKVRRMRWLSPELSQILEKQ